MTSYQLQFVITEHGLGESEGVITLDPDHPHHMTNIREMPPLRRAILKAFLETNLADVVLVEEEMMRK